MGLVACIAERFPFQLESNFKKEKVMQIGYAVIFIAGVLALLTLPGCSSGFEFRTGLYPINEVAQHQYLKPEIDHGNKK